MSKQIEEAVRDRYGSFAESALSSEHTGVRAVAEAFGYSADELSSIPAEANMGLSCGNPTASAHLRPGEVVVDLGCGGGLDIFLASAKVGPEGRAIGKAEGRRLRQFLDRQKETAPVVGDMRRGARY